MELLSCFLPFRYIFWAHSSSLSGVNMNKSHKSLSALSSANTALNVCVSGHTTRMVLAFYPWRNVVSSFIGMEWNTQCWFFHVYGTCKVSVSYTCQKNVLRFSLISASPQVLPYSASVFWDLFISLFIFFGNYRRHLLAQMAQSCMKMRF